MPNADWDFVWQYYSLAYTDLHRLSQVDCLMAFLRAVLLRSMRGVTIACDDWEDAGLFLAGYRQDQIIVFLSSGRHSQHKVYVDETHAKCGGYDDESLVWNLRVTDASPSNQDGFLETLHLEPSHF
eukprot:s3255_g6.t1